MHRRSFLTLLGTSAAAAPWPLAARAQQRTTAAIGWLSSRSAATDAQVLPAFHQALNAQGFVEGRNVTIEYRYGDGQVGPLPELAADLVRRQVTVIVAVGNGIQGTRAVQATSPTMPIVFIDGVDPVDVGVVPNFNRPGGNVTGVITFQARVAAKRLGLLRDLLPRATKIGVVAPGPIDVSGPEIADVQDAARVLGMQVRILNASNERELDAAFATLAQSRPDVLFFGASPFFFTRADQILASAERLGLPTSYWRREFVVGGGLMSYGSNAAEAYRVLGDYAGRILKGEKAGDLPIQQPTKLEFTLNLKTAKALGLEVPTSMLLLADEVIE